MININGEVWRIWLVSPHHPILLMGDGNYAIGACDDPLKLIAINNTLDKDYMKHVLCHELTHAAMFSYNVDLSYEQEELIADLFATYGQEIIKITNAFM